MTSVVLCPNCGGQKTVSKPAWIAGDVSSWVDNGSPTYPCPTCEGRGWIQVYSAQQTDFDCVKSIALSSMETAETLMDECTKRADRIKEIESERDSTIRRLAKEHNNDIDELETELKRMQSGERAADEEIERLCLKILDIERREDLVTTELEQRACMAEDRLREVKEMRDELLEDWEAKRRTIAQLEYSANIAEKYVHKLESQRAVIRKLGDEREDELAGIIDDLVSERERDETDLEMLGEILKIVNLLIDSGYYAQPMAYYQQLSNRMSELCLTVVQFRSKHNTVG